MTENNAPIILEVAAAIGAHLEMVELMPLWAEVIIRHREKRTKEFFGVCLVSIIALGPHYGLVVVGLNY